MDKKAYKEAVKAAKESAWATRQCCGTCEHLDEFGRCTVFNSFPPLEYITTDNNCNKYMIYLPF